MAIPKDGNKRDIAAELIGRRLFGKQGWDDSKPSFTFIHFVDSRFDQDLSVDCLGPGNTETKRIRPLTRLGDTEAAARVPVVTFDGWAAVLAKDLAFPGWLPLVRPSEQPDNPYHAEIIRDGFRDKAHSYAFATAMADRFSRKGRYVSPIRTRK
jgi:hypothetical protein